MLTARETDLLELIGCCAWCDAAQITAESHRAGIIVYQGGSVVGIWTERDQLVFRSIDDLRPRTEASSAEGAHLRTLAMAVGRTWSAHIPA